MITAEHFKAATNREPEHDDLDRSNCTEAGRAGHLCCGWDHERDLPQFEVGPLPWNGMFPRTSAEPK
jgi:hypothetical protein